MCIKLSILFSYNRVFSNRIRFLIYEPGRDQFNKLIVSPSAYRSTTSPRERTTELLSLTPSLSRIGEDQNFCLRHNLHIAIPLVAGLVNDIAILLLPAAGLWNLQIARVKKFSADSTLPLGISAYAIAIVWNYLIFLREEKRRHHLDQRREFKLEWRRGDRMGERPGHGTNAETRSLGPKPLEFSSCKIMRMLY